MIPTILLTPIGTQIISDTDSKKYSDAIIGEASSDMILLYWYWR